MNSRKTTRIQTARRNLRTDYGRSKRTLKAATDRRRKTHCVLPLRHRRKLLIPDELAAALETAELEAAQERQRAEEERQRAEDLAAELARYRERFGELSD